MKTSACVAYVAAIIFALNCVVAATSDASPLIRRKDFIRAYVGCNNEAWSGVSHALIPYGFSLPHSARFVDPEVQGFFNLGYLSPERTLQEPNSWATLRWAAFVKAYADDGGIERRFLRRGVAIAYLRHNAAMQSPESLSDLAAASLATNLHVTLLGRDKRAWVLNGFLGSQWDSVLTPTTAATMLRVIGSHEAVGSEKTVSASVRPCRTASALRFLRASEDAGRRDPQR